MSRSKAAKGFTLIEVALAVTLGVVMLAGVIAIYNQVRESVATGKMKEKVMTAAAVIEEISAQSGSYPNPTVAAEQNRAIAKYQATRPDDYNISPWGGSVGGDIQTGLNPYWMQPSNTMPVIGSEETMAADDLQNLRGGIQYFALGIGTVLTPGATGSFWDKAAQRRVEYRGWVVSGVNPQNRDGWCVWGPRP